MVTLGYVLSGEEHAPNDLVKNAKRAEETGFDIAWISDHYHPWVDQQGHAAFVWSVIGGISQATERLRLGTGVTCPTIRIHPAIIAQAVATTGCMMPGRFFLGVGSGENLNEHILGDHWPPTPVRQAMLAEAIEVIRTLWEGGYQSYYGDFYTVENARIYDLPEEQVPIMVGAAGPQAAEIAGEMGDGLVSVAPTQKVIESFEEHGGSGKPRYGQLTMCWASDEAEAVKTAHKQWPNSGIQGELSQELPLPRHFEQAAMMVREEDIAQSVVCGPDPEKYHQRIREYTDAGFDHVFLHQVGPDQEGFFDFAKREILPKYS